MNSQTNPASCNNASGHTGAQAQPVARMRGLSVQSGVTAGPQEINLDDSIGGRLNNHNQTQASSRSCGLRVQSGVKAGPDPDPEGPGTRDEWIMNHNQTQARGHARAKLERK